MKKISKLVVGYNKEWKQEINIGSKNNQNFVSIPFRKILDILKYKLEDNGIEYKEQEESYTSKASYLDNDDIPIYKEETEEIKFSGKRIKRGIYKSKQGKIINADLKWSIEYIEEVRRETNRRIRISQIQQYIYKQVSIAIRTY